MRYLAKSSSELFKLKTRQVKTCIELREEAFEAFYLAKSCLNRID